ncbi:hypothetical protein J5226_19325 [Lysobacter sp. K5869]|uniref:hypothetical protein n=1 Tax=Lysobacter sp. K5869 TaxID=2820808 RepID=UPI001C06325B|nr:hypothetical protein [Lysobacter sp. K5869]QWP75738.1 hypothetical protein J5226_19325 [Lysobacter sp. K5869]
MLAAIGAAVAVGVDGEPPKGWVAVEPPRTEAGRYCANYSRESWAVETAANGTLRLRSARRGDGDLTVREVLADGALLGYNHGEFGGRIEWLPRDGGARFEMKDVNPVASTQYRGQVIVAQGLAHLGLNDGSVLRFERLDGRRWRIHRLAELDAAPVAALRRGDDAWWLLLSDGLAKVSLQSGKLERVYRNDDWRFVRPDTIQALGQGWLLGAARGVIHLQPTPDGGYRQRWWIPAQCAALEPTCSCADPPY